MRRHILIFVALVLAISGCATTRLAPVSSGDVAFEQDEKRLWARAKEETDALKNGGVLYEDHALNRYLNQVARKLVPADTFRSIPFVIHVIRNPHLNAFTMPDGAIYIHTGLLARMENEAQLATLLAHEMTHATHRHAIREFRSTRNKAAFFATMSFTIGSVPVVGGLTNLMGSLGSRAAISGYSQAMETEADTEGFHLLRRAGDDPTEAPKLFDHLLDDTKEEGVAEPFFFGTHPRLSERIGNYTRLIKDLPPAARKGARHPEAFLDATRRLLLENAHLDIKAGRFGPAERAAKKSLASRPKTAGAHLVLGDIYRQRNAEGDMDLAKTHYTRAIGLDATNPAPHKGLGLVHYRLGDKAAAKKALRAYLTGAPSAPDRGYVEETIRQIDGRTQ
ncbi:MAG: M48 family metalloprotease [Nitrospiria bacterium]